MKGFDVAIVKRLQPGDGPAFELDVELHTGGGIAVVFGASGAGKTTLLMNVLGAMRPDRGRIACGERVLFDGEGGIDVSVRRRRLGIVFQDALLFPHMTVEHNVAFGGSDAPAWLERVGALDLASRRPHELSGGQRQRVALARALAAEPDGLLLDEPFSALDEPSREQLGRVLLEQHARTGVPFLHVTHDIAEALRVGDELLVLERGRVVQAGAPAEVIAAPASAATARAVGTENLFSGRIVAHHAVLGYTEVDLGGTRVLTVVLPESVGERVALGLRAEDVLLSLRALHETSARNVIAGTIESVDERGVAREVLVATPVRFRVVVTPAAVEQLGLRPGVHVHLLIKAASFHRVV